MGFFQKAFFLTGFFSLSMASANVKQTLASLYPDLSPGILEQRMAIARTPEEFFRQFVAYFHLVAKQQVFTLPEFKDLSKIDGWCTGDPHTENFGALIATNGRAFFLMNDKDDAGPCPLTSDVLRMLVSWQYVSDKVPTNDLVSAYLAGLSGRAAPGMPKYVQGLIKRGEKKGLVPDSRWMDLDKMRFRKDSELREVPSQVAQALTEALGGDIFRDWNVVDVRQRFKIKGGSGGNFRYLLLLERRKEEHVLVEFKEIVRPATFVYDPPILSPQERMVAALHWEMQPVLGLWDRTAMVFNRPFFIRPLWDGQSDVTEKDFDHSDVVPVAQFEAYVVGDLHRRSADMRFVAPRFLNVSISSWEKATRILAKAELDAFHEIHPELQF